VALAISQSTLSACLIPRSSELAVSADRTHGVRYKAKFGGMQGRGESTHVVVLILATFTRLDFQSPSCHKCVEVGLQEIAIFAHGVGGRDDAVDIPPMTRPK